MRRSVILMVLLAMVCFFGVNPAIVNLAIAEWSPLPKDLNIVEPGPEVPPSIAKLSGKWTGVYMTLREQIMSNAQVVFERIEIDPSNGTINATVVSSVGSSMNFVGGYIRQQTTIDKEGRCVLKNLRNNATLKMILVDDELRVEWISNRVFTATLHHDRF